jgi:TRAP-type C4-dicarboxylate transport system permease small subunit
MNDERTNTVTRRLDRAVEWLGVLERYVTGSLVIVMTGLYVFNIFVRAVLPVFASDFAWVDEAARYMMVWVVFLAAGITLEVGRHVSVDIAHQYLSARAVRAIFKVIDVVGLVFCLAVAHFALNLAIFVAGTGQVSPTLGVPTYILYIAPCVGFLLVALRYFLRLIGWRGRGSESGPPAWLGGGHI